MKSKKIVSLVAMTAMLAACSQDELVSIAGDAKVDLGNRPVIGNVALGLGDIQTRMELAAGSSLRFDWVNGDQIGAAIVDLPVSTPVSGKDFSSEGGEDYSALSWTYDEYLANVKKGAESDVTYEQAGLTAKDFYQTHDYISSNYPYEYKDGSFNTQANLVEGNYVFYAPYNAANLMRKPIKAVLPMEQDCSSTTMKKTKYKQKDAEVSSTVLEQFYKGTIEGFENAPVVLGYQFLAAPTDGSVIRPKVEMNQLYAFPMITVKNDFTGRLYGEANDNTSTAVDAKGVTMTIDSIQIYHENAASNIFYTALTKAGQIAGKLATDGEWGGKRFTEGAPTAELLDASSFETAYLHHGATNAIKLGAANAVLGNKANRVTCVIGKELKKGEDYHFHAILPAADYEKKLKARVFVTIDEKQYVIAKAKVAATTFETSEWADFTFEDEVNGGQNCVLIRGEHYPQAEFQQDGNGTKSFAGNMMTLVLGEGTAAFELDDHAVAPVVDNGLKTNAELINYLVNNVQRGVNITECPDLKKVELANWKTSTEGGITAAAGNLAFSANNTIIINAELVAALAQQVYVKGDETFTLATNLPVANDVKLSVDGDVYTYTTLGETPVSFAFTMTGVTMGNTATALVAGINKIGASDQDAPVTATLALAEKAKDAVVVLAGAATPNVTTVTVNNGGAGINAIYVNANTKLVVSGKACNALIIANGGVIELQAGASLTNKNNEFAASVVITNNIAGVIEGKIAEGATVAATYGASWPTAKIAATSRINAVTINLSTENTNFQIEQAQMDIFSNLTDGVALTLGSNIKGITSDSNVVLTNLTALNSDNAITWTTTSNTGITVSHKGAAIDSNVTMGSGVTLIDTAE